MRWHQRAVASAVCLMAGALSVACDAASTSGVVQPDGGCPVPACAAYFTEILADPKTDDAQNEFVEIHNPGNQPLDLRRCTLELRKAGSTQRHRIAGENDVSVPPGGYLLFGPENSENVDYRWTELSPLPNSSKDVVELALSNGRTDVTLIRYVVPEESGAVGLGKPKSGASYQLGADNLTCQPDALIVPDHWCLSTDAHGENLATPGAPNARCPIIETCRLGPCALHFTEVLADPATDDDQNEYIELRNGGDAAATLNGCALELVKGETVTTHIIQDTDLITVAVGDHVTLGPPNAGDRVEYRWQEIGGLPNSSRTGAVTLRLRNPETDQIIDSFTYLDPAGLDGPTSGASFQACRDIGYDCFANDDPTHWSVIDRMDDDENRGTRSVANLPCLAPLPCQPTQCDGQPVGPERAIRQPTTGDVIFTEIYADAPQDVGSERTWEWFELYNTTQDELDLNGLMLFKDSAAGVEPDHVLAAQSCLTLPPRSYQIIAANPLAETNGGVEVCAGLTFAGFSLGNRDGYLALRHPDGVLIDEVTWGTTSPGRSWALSPECGLDAVSNDDSGCWCYSQRPQYSGDQSPHYHTANGPNERCTACYCRDGTNQWVHVPDSFDPGELEIVEVLANVPGRESDRSAWEWVEILASGAGYLNCGALVRNNPMPFPWDDCVELQRGDRVVLAASADSTQNGGLPHCTYEMGGLSLTGSATLELTIQGTVIDRVEYPDPGDGIAAQMEEATGAWCGATEAYGEGEALGTPCLPNSSCPDTPIDPPEVPEGFCVPPDGGLPRPAQSPGPGDLVVSELMSNPDGPDGGHEWLELYVAGMGPFDLNGLQLTIGGDNTETLDATDCVTVSRDNWPVIAQDGSGSMRLRGTLVNRDLMISLHTPDGLTLIDAMQYAPAVGQGEAVSLDSGALDAVSNDAEENWCRQPGGTPGAPNGSCL